MEQIKIMGYGQFRNIIKWYEELKNTGLTEAKAMKTIWESYTSNRVIRLCKCGKPIEHEDISLGKLLVHDENCMPRDSPRGM